MKQHESEKVKPLDKETAKLKRKLFAHEEGEEHKEDNKPKPKKRKVKGVNPLAMKKKKVKIPPPSKKKNNQRNNTNNNNSSSTSAN